MALSAFARKTHMERTRAESLVFVVASTVIALGTLFAVAWVAGFGPVAARMRAVDPIWFLAAFGAEAVAYVGYVLSYREVARVDERGTSMSARTAIASVTAGFGAFVARGGFAVDLHAFQQPGVSDREARVRVLGLGALEYALLGPAACVTAIVLLANGGRTPNLALTLPWAIAVPVGFIAALWAVRHRQRFVDRGGWREPVSEALESIHVLKCLFKTKHLIGPLGTAVYWFGDIVCLWACLKAFTHGTPDIELLLLAYATGYALTRRTLPLAGAGAVEALLPFALSWYSISLAAAVLAVFAYRVFNLWLPLLPAALGLRSLRAAAAES
jgi:uncharacterized membrane protein YbhN (UPF0104 family)